MGRIPLDLQRGKGEMLRVLSASSTNREINPGISFAAAKGICPLVFSELGQAATQLQLHEIWGKEEKQRFPHFLRGVD